jgi:glutamate synthase domain-containing protein 3
MDGADITVNGNVQDGVGNTMNDGQIIVYGDAGDICGHSMRGGTVMVEGLVGYRCGIHCKAYGEHYPVMVVGTTAGAYFGEYMAGGVLTILNTEDTDIPVGDYCGTGMHGGLMFIRGEIEDYQLGAECGRDDLTDTDWELLEGIIGAFCETFGEDAGRFAADQFVKIYPKTSRPYGNMYAY